MWRVSNALDGKGRVLDNIFVERHWHTLKSARLEDRITGRAGVCDWMEFYNHRRPHSGPGGKPPAMVYRQHIDQTQPDQQMQQVA
ncbi:integrase core domain-containing protein [Pelagibacterium montanilacus]|uniref:integrase core domain-containing protein n=1 Tax=Pelagibacterium montanilacus TaxID=2185280 RepID=UPI0019D21E5D